MQFLDIHEPGETPLPHAGEAGVAIGIDLGTTHSVVAVSRDGDVTVLTDAQGRALLPSVVAYHHDDITVGDEARARLGSGQGVVVASVKRLMGRAGSEVKTLAGTLPYPVETGDGPARIRVGDKRVTAVEVSAEILRMLKARAEDALGREVTQAVVTVPAYFDDAARAATRDAARLAGLEVLRMINEPTAAALAYGLDSGAEGVYAVYDLGGGTFDISLLKLEKGVFQVLATGGDAQLGGDDFDHAIAEHWLQGKHVSPEEAQSMLVRARRVKEALSDAEHVEADGFSLDRATFETLAAPLVARTLMACRRVLADAKRSLTDIKGVVLVGGATRVPLVRAQVKAFFGQEPLAGVNPDEVVAAGAALQAEALTRGSDTLLIDVLPLSLGIETMGGLVEKVLPRNTPIPVTMAQEFTTYADGQTGMQLHVVQGEREMAPDCRSLARFELTGIPSMAAGAARIKVMFSVDADGLLTVEAMEQTTGALARVEVKPSYGLEEDEMIAMLEDAMRHGREDMALRMLVEARVEAERVLGAVRAAMEADADLVTVPERQAIAAAERELIAALHAEDRDALLRAQELLEKAAGPFAERRMNTHLAGALSGKTLHAVENALEDKL